MNGNNYWPTWGSGQYGAIIFPSGCHPAGHSSFYFRFPYFYGLVEIGNYFNMGLLTQSLDTLGNRQWGDSGYQMTYINSVFSSHFPEVNSVPDDIGGLVAVFTYQVGGPFYDIYAKRVNSDGSLGGPLPAIEEVTISITGNDLLLTWPSQGDSVQYNIFKSTEPYQFFFTNPDTTISDTVFVDVGGAIQPTCFYNVTFQP
jgi:hypothetical protein